MEIRLLNEKYDEKDGTEVNIYGWVRNKRIGKNVSFLQLNDGTCFDTIQVVFANLDNQEEIQKAHLGSAIEVKGIVKKLENNKQDYEIEAISIEILAASDETYPLQPKRHTYEFLREIAHLRVRTNTFNSVFRIRSMLSFALHEFFNKEGYIYLHSPILTSSDAEGAGEMLQVTTLDLDHNIQKNKEGEVDYKKDFFNQKTSLTVSGQLLAEAYALAFKKVYTFGPTFRAENSNTKKHAAEFWMLEPEVAFFELKDIIQLADNMLKTIIQKTINKHLEEFKFLDDRSDNKLLDSIKLYLESSLKILEYKDAIDILKKSKVNFENSNIEFGMDLNSEHEKYLAEIHCKGPVVVINYPKELKAFYMYLNDDKKTVAAFDLLVPGIGELIGGSQREVRLDMLKQRMNTLNISEEDLKWYLDLRRFGDSGSSGFGLGFERLVMYVTGIENIRDVLPYPRTTGNLKM